jgi:hypothetical protein
VLLFFLPSTGHQVLVMLCVICRFGDITQVHIVRDPSSNMCKGFCFISFDNKEQAGQALEGRAQHRLRLRLAALGQDCGLPLVRHLAYAGQAWPPMGHYAGGPRRLGRGVGSSQRDALLQTTHTALVSCCAHAVGPDSN